MMTYKNTDICIWEIDIYTIKVQLSVFKEEVSVCKIQITLFKPEDHWSCIAHLSAEDML